ncbi:hypothetical protein SAMN05428963_10375 [Consotaella salsifontis]|uniref:Uncharacterized protein n=1 Tax=Consotaella salsifontis TaxID=1365950 RepID=A0A1T4NLF7_9HYPH|nr:hypothetical protein SAMN05428963_10375 [Consotaella salsifontis]
MIAEAGHMPQIEQPDSLRSAIVNFVETLR